MGRINPKILQLAFACAQTRGEEALADLAENVGNRKNDNTPTKPAGKVNFFLATDSDFVRLAARTLLGSRLLVTEGKPEHSANSNSVESLKIAEVLN
jgi:hypothetical protein